MKLLLTICLIGGLFAREASAEPARLPVADGVRSATRPDSAVSNEMIASLDGNFLRRMQIVDSVMTEKSRVGSTRWQNLSGVWAGFREKDTIQVAVGSLSDLSKGDVEQLVEDIKRSPDVSAALRVAKWDPERYVRETHVVMQTAFLLSAAYFDSTAGIRKASEQFHISAYPSALAFVKSHSDQLCRLGFARVDPKNPACSLPK